MAFETVIELVTANVRERLTAAAIDELVYAAALMSADTEDVSVAHIAIGLERDRAHTLDELEPEEALELIWNAYEFAREAPGEPDLENDPTFRAAATREREAVGADPWTGLGGDPRDYVLNRVAANIGADPPLPSVTDDFVVYAFTDDLADELVANMMFSATPAAARLLQARHLLPG